MRPGYAERLHVPLRWWVLATMFLATFWIAFIVSLPAWLAWAAAGALTVVTYAMFLWVGSVRVAVEGGQLVAGPAHIPLPLLGEPRPLDKEATRRVHGVEADARAFLVTRPYVKRSVLVPVEDPADPTPYWLISTRNPAALAAALVAGPGTGTAGDGAGSAADD